MTDWSTTAFRKNGGKSARVPSFSIQLGRGIEQDCNCLLPALSLAETLLTLSPLLPLLHH